MPRVTNFERCFKYQSEISVFSRRGLYEREHTQIIDAALYFLIIVPIILLQDRRPVGRLP